jgi:hypothetical protein
MKCGQMDNTKTHLKETGDDSVNWINLAENRGQ